MHLVSGSRFLHRCQAILLLSLCLVLGGGTASAQTSTLPIDSLEARAERAAESGSTAVAIKLYSRILERDSTNLGALSDRGFLYADQGQYAQAAADLGQFQKVDPTTPADIIGSRGWFLTLAGDLEKARELARRAIEMDPSPGTWQLNLGHTYLLDDQPRTAKYYYRKAIARIETQEELKQYLSDFDTFIEQNRSPEEAETMKDWFHVTYLSEGEELRSREGGLLAFLGTWITLVVGLISLFQRGGEAMTEKGRSAVRSWLLRSKVEEKVSSWAESFESLFDAVFTERHLSWACFSRSVLASAIVVSVVLLGMIGFGTATPYEVAMTGLADSWIAGVLYAFGFVILVNSFVDYISLYQTRWIISRMSGASNTVSHLVYLILDAVLTTGIIVLSVGGLQVFALAMQGGLDASVWQLIVEMPLFLFHVLSAGEEPILIAMFASTYFTSVWIWLYAIAGLILQGSLSFLRGADWMKELFDVENQPVQALGIMLAVLATAVFALSAPFVL